MSNDEEKEEEEVRREHTHLEEEQRFVSLSVRSIFLRIIRAFRCIRRAILDFFSARDRRALERGGGAAVARNFAHCLILGWFFLLVMMMPIIAMMCSDVALFVSFLSTTGRRTLRGGRRGRGARGWCARSFRVVLLMTTF